MTAPQHIEVEGFAHRLGIKVSVAGLAGSSGTLIWRNGGMPEMVVSDRLSDPGERRFTIAHELGHYVLQHRPLPIDRMCTPLIYAPDAPDDPEEVEADSFASELLMPELLVRSACELGWPSIDAALRIAYTFGVSTLAAAVRYAELTETACAIVLSERGTVRRFVRSATFPGHVACGRPLDRRSAAWDYFDRDELLRPGIRHVPAPAWLDGTTETRLMENSIASHERGTVLTMLWVPALPIAVCAAAALPVDDEISTVRLRPLRRHRS